MALFNLRVSQRHVHRSIGYPSAESIADRWSSPRRPLAKGRFCSAPESKSPRPGDESEEPVANETYGRLGSYGADGRNYQRKIKSSLPLAGATRAAILNVSGCSHVEPLSSQSLCERFQEPSRNLLRAASQRLGAAAGGFEAQPGLMALDP